MSRTVTDPQPLLFFCWLLTGITSFIGAIIWLIVKPDLLSREVMDSIVVSWTHLTVLGWLCSLFFAAGYQLIPVVTLNPLKSRVLSRMHYCIHTVGFLTMVHAFAQMDYRLVAIGGSFVFIGFVLFIVNGLLSAGFESKWSHVSVLWFLGLFWLFAGGCVALVAVYLRLKPNSLVDFMEILGVHVHTMLIGFFFTLLIAASSKLIPMFMLSPEKPQWGTWISGIVSSAVLIVSYFTVGTELSINSTLCIIMALPIVTFYGQLTFFVAKKRRALDPGLSLFFIGTLFLIPAWIKFYQYHGGYASTGSELNLLRAGTFILIVLVFNGCILGMAQKIVPFMMWHHLYSKYLGRKKVPQTVDFLVPWTLSPIAICFVLSGMLFMIVFFGNQTQLIRPAAVFILLAYIFFALNAPRFISHWKNPVLEDFTPVVPKKN